MYFHVLWSCDPYLRFSLSSSMRVQLKTYFKEGKHILQYVLVMTVASVHDRLEVY